MNLETYGWDEFFAGHFAPFAAEGFSVGRVFLQHNKIYMLYTERGDVQAEVTGRLLYHTLEREELPAVGDWVVIREFEQGRAKIHERLPRKSKFSRRAAGSRTEEQVVAANVDTVFLVTGLDNDYNPRRLERYLIMAWESGARPVVVLNKADLAADAEEKRAEVESTATDVPVVVTSARAGQGVELLLPFVRRGQTVALMGSSGVGKSTLVNQLIGSQVQRTSEVRLHDDRGRHTTTHRELFVLESGALIIDTPGMRELQLLVSDRGLRETFEDIEDLASQCRFSDCRHADEPGCRIRGALETGELDTERYENYQKMQQEMLHTAALQDQRKAQLEKERTKRLSRAVKKHRKNR